MKTVAKALLVLIVSITVIGCKSEDAQSDNENINIGTEVTSTLDGKSAELVQSINELPSCDASKEGRLFYVTELEEFHVCVALDEGAYEYQKVDIKGPTGENGQDGIDGSDGADGTSSLIQIDEIPYANEQCPNGGHLFTTYLDTNNNQQLDEGEAYGSPAIICNGFEPGKDPYLLDVVLQDVTPIGVTVSGFARKWYVPDEKIRIKVYLNGDIDLGTLIAEGDADQFQSVDLGFSKFEFTIDLGEISEEIAIYTYAILDDVPTLINNAPLIYTPTTDLFPGISTLQLNPVERACSCHEQEPTFQDLWPDLKTPADINMDISATNNLLYDLAAGQRGNNHPSGRVGNAKEIAKWWCSEFEPNNRLCMASFPITNEDLLAMDTIVVTAVIDSEDNVKWYSDIGNNKVTILEDMQTSDYPAMLSEITEDAPLQVKEGQKMEFCVFSTDGQKLRMHTAGGGGTFGHWSGDQQLAASTCSFGREYPSTLGSVAPRELYNHNGTELGSSLFLELVFILEESI